VEPWPLWRSELSRQNSSAFSEKENHVPHHHRRRGGFRGRRFGGPVWVDNGPDVIEETVLVVPSQLDAIFVPPTDDPEPKIPQAGMTFFENDQDRYHQREAAGTDDNIVRAAEIDRAMSVLMRDVSQNMQANQDYINMGQDVVGLQADWAAWRTGHTSYFQMMGTEDDLSRFGARYSAIRDRFKTLTGKEPTAPVLTTVPPSNPLGIPSTPDIVKVVAAVGAVAALVIFGPALVRSFSH
jgi:hypothetical protein